MYEGSKYIFTEIDCGVDFVKIMQFLRGIIIV
jgi:hypothetical protein